MVKTNMIDDAKVMSKGQVTIPKEVRTALGINTGDRVTFIVNGNEVKIVNSTIFALLQLQQKMKGEASKVGLMSEDDIMKWNTTSCYFC